MGMVFRYIWSFRRHACRIFFHKLMCVSHLPLCMEYHNRELQFCLHERVRGQERKTDELSLREWHIVFHRITKTGRDALSAIDGDTTKLAIICICHVHGAELSNFRIKTPYTKKKTSSYTTRCRECCTARNLSGSEDELFKQTSSLKENGDPMCHGDLNAKGAVQHAIRADAWHKWE